MSLRTCTTLFRLWNITEHMMTTILSDSEHEIRDIVALNPAFVVFEIPYIFFIYSL